MATETRTTAEIMKWFSIITISQSHADVYSHEHYARKANARHTVSSSKVNDQSKRADVSKTSRDVASIGNQPRLRLLRCKSGVPTRVMSALGRNFLGKSGSQVFHLVDKYQFQTFDRLSRVWRVEILTTQFAKPAQNVADELFEQFVSASADTFFDRR